MKTVHIGEVSIFDRISFMLFESKHQKRRGRMSEPFLGQVTMLALTYAPQGYALCNGQQMLVTQNQALAALLGTYYGGDGRTNFNLPDLRGRTPISALPSADQSWQPGSYMMGNMVGAESVTLTAQQIPAHAHTVYASTQNATDGAPSNDEVLANGSMPLYASLSSPIVPLGGGSLGAAGQTAHANMQPFLTINMCIALTGIFPTRQ
jgi:microcystin-dependent protein